jgi:hypothetical protein
MSVSASDGCTVPSVVVKETCVPLCGGVPAASITCAMRSVEPLTGRAEAVVVNVIVDPEGARSGTRSHELDSTSAAAESDQKDAQRNRDIMKTLNILLP